MTNTPRYQLYIDGKQRSAERYQTVINPYDGSAVGEVALGNADDVELAGQACAAAFEHTRRMPVYERARILRAISDGIARESEALSRTIAKESGKPIRYARGEVKRASDTFALAAGQCRTFEGEVVPIDQRPGTEGRLGLFRRVPRGPVLAISPFNFPLNLVAHKLAPALAVGAPVTLKPAAQAPITAHQLARIVEEAGTPPGAFNVVHCEPEVADSMVTDDRYRVLSFTGSDALGWRLKGRAPKKYVLLELGGNAPSIVDQGVDLEKTAARLAESAWANAGQVCIKTQRIFVHRDGFEEFLGSFLRATEAVRAGNPLDDDTMVGPLIDAGAVRRVLDWIAEAERQGARRWCGGTVEGQVLSPTVLTGTAAEQRVRCEEVFGPVAIVEPAESFEHALKLANDSRYGLQASVFTPSVDHALLAYDRLDYGGILVNDPPTLRVDNAPYGGMKDSGMGREGVPFAMLELTEPKLLSLNRL